MSRQKQNPLEPPQTIYVYWYEDGDEPYLSASEVIEDCATQDETRLVGEYQLVQTHEVSLEVKREVVVKGRKK